MSGFSLKEVGVENQLRHWQRGGFPRSYLAQSENESFEWRRDFVLTFLERDVPQFGVIVGVSLAGAIRMRFRPYPPRPNKREGTFALHLEPRSVYVLRNEARWGWQHSIPTTKNLRYSVTLRTFEKHDGVRRRIAR